MQIDITLSLVLLNIFRFNVFNSR